PGGDAGSIPHALRSEKRLMPASRQTRGNWSDRYAALPEVPADVDNHVERVRRVDRLRPDRREAVRPERGGDRGRGVGGRGVRWREQLSGEGGKVAAARAVNRRRILDTRDVDEQ